MTKHVVVGEGAVAELAAVLAPYHADHVLLVTSRESYNLHPKRRMIEAQLASKRVTRVNNFSPNPTEADLYKILGDDSLHDVDLVVSVGGGSAIDMGKLLAASLSNSNVELAGLLTGKLPLAVDALPHLALPTTAGSGSEATHFAVVYVNGSKFSLAHPSIRPDVALVDPSLSSTMTARLTALSGVDALCQAIESCWSVRATRESTAHARKALRLILANLETSVLNPGGESRLSMAVAAYHAGCAIDISRTTAPHALSYTLTSKYGVPHGQAVCVFLPDFLAFNAGVNDSDCLHPGGVRGVREVLALIQEDFNCASLEEVCEHLRKIIRNVGLVDQLSDLGIRAAEDLRKVAAGVNVQRLNNNPREVTEASLNQLLCYPECPSQ